MTKRHIETNQLCMWKRLVGQMNHRVAFHLPKRLINLFSNFLWQKSFANLLPCNNLTKKETEKCTIGVCAKSLISFLNVTDCKKDEEKFNDRKVP